MSEDLRRLAAFLRSRGIPLLGITDTSPPALQFPPGVSPEDRARVADLLAEFGEMEWRRQQQGR